MCPVHRLPFAPFFLMYVGHLFNGVQIRTLWWCIKNLATIMENPSQYIKLLKLWIIVLIDFKIALISINHTHTDCLLLMFTAKLKRFSIVTNERSGFFLATLEEYLCSMMAWRTVSYETPNSFDICAFWSIFLIIKRSTRL